MVRRYPRIQLLSFGVFLAVMVDLLTPGATRNLIAANARAGGEGGGIGRVQESKAQVWAVLGDALAVESGFTDLLLVQLAERNFQLVERIQLGELEQELQRSLDLGTLDTTMEIGRRVGAERLIVCQYRPEPNRGEDASASLRVFVCDTELVARIATAEFEFADLSECAENVTNWLMSPNTFPKIERVIGLAPFGCKNLGLDYQEIGSFAHDNLSEQLLAIPGTALFEWQETRALNREMDVTDAAGQRIVPWLFAVDYRVIAEEDKAPPQVEVTLRSQSAGESSAEQKTLDLVELEGWLRSRILG